MHLQGKEHIQKLIAIKYSTIVLLPVQNSSDFRTEYASSVRGGFLFLTIEDAIAFFFAIFSGRSFRPTFRLNEFLPFLDCAVFRLRHFLIV
jgi:hypothetical protein